MSGQFCTLSMFFSEVKSMFLNNSVRGWESKKHKVVDAKHCAPNFAIDHVTGSGVLRLGTWLAAVFAQLQNWKSTKQDPEIWQLFRCISIFGIDSLPRVHWNYSTRHGRKFVQLIKCHIYQSISWFWYANAKIGKVYLGMLLSAGWPIQSQTPADREGNFP